MRPDPPSHATNVLHPNRQTDKPIEKFIEKANIISEKFKNSTYKNAYYYPN